MLRRADWQIGDVTKARGVFGTSAVIYQSTWRNITDDLDPHQHCYENPEFRKSGYVRFGDVTDHNPFETTQSW